MTGFARGGIVREPPDGSDEVPVLLDRGYVLLSPLPRRIRAKLAVKRAVNVLGCWLVEHGHHKAAMRLWRIQEKP